jgi:pimeloyl-ACP methyl ester carboxylesterase
MTKIKTSRPWKLEMGLGKRLIIILPRMDTDSITEEEWKQILNPFMDDAKYLIIDMPEKLLQEKGLKVEFTVQELAMEVHSYLNEQSLLPDMIWGFSLGGMIAQELSVLNGMQDIPLLLISTMAYADYTLQAVFSSWAIITQAFGEQGFQKCLIPWIQRVGELPLFSKPNEVPIKINSDPLAIRKAISSLRSVSFHDARLTLPKIKALTLVLFGEDSVLLHEQHAQLFHQNLKQGKVKFVPDAGMRILTDNPTESINQIKSYMNVCLV